MDFSISALIFLATGSEASRSWMSAMLCPVDGFSGVVPPATSPPALPSPITKVAVMPESLWPGMAQNTS